MGAWGPGLFENDDAVDLREGYRVFLADAQSDTGATEAAALDFGASFERPGDTTAFWLALGLIQWRMGRLDPHVKTLCLQIIDQDLDLAQWTNPSDRKKRASVLRKLRETLTSPQPPSKPMPKPVPVQLPGLEFSEVIGYRAPNGMSVLLHVLNYRAWSTLTVKAPVVSILNWFSDQMPSETDLPGLTYINHDGRIGGHHLHCLAMPPKKALKLEQFVRPGWKKPVTRGEATSAVCGLSGQEGGTLDRMLNTVLWPYWKDPSRPAHLPKSFPPDMDKAEREKLYNDLHARMFGAT